MTDNEQQLVGKKRPLPSTDDMDDLLTLCNQPLSKRMKPDFKSKFQQSDDDDFISFKKSKVRVE